MLRKFVGQFDTQNAAAEQLEVSPQFLSEMVSGKRPISDMVLPHLGLRRVMRIERIPEKDRK